jgi:isopentenyl diphosphate isomerase/L-lactate dehydrogenase-like FMN-dependent dehydrogenase
MFSDIDPTAAGGLGATWVTWDYVAELRDLVRGKLLLKGILAAEDAEMALAYGVDGIVVSNHGGRSEESGLSTIEALADIAPVVNGRMPIILDSGIRRGPDIFKAIALGATAVGVGRPPCWGLAAMGQQGVEAVIDILNVELAQIMRQAGTASLADITGDYVRRLA